MQNSEAENTQPSCAPERHVEQADLLRTKGGETPLYYTLVEFAKTQSVTAELLKFELDALSETIEINTKEITDMLIKISEFANSETIGEKVSTELLKSLDQIIRSLQFQDIAEQKIKNISDTMTTMQDYSNQLATTTKSEQGDTSSISSNEEYIEKVISERSLEGMRSSMLTNLKSVSNADFEKISDSLSNSILKPASQDDDSNIDLF